MHVHWDICDRCYRTSNGEKVTRLQDGVLCSRVYVVVWRYPKDHEYHPGEDKEELLHFCWPCAEAVSRETFGLEYALKEAEHGRRPLPSDLAAWLKAHLDALTDGGRREWVSSHSAGFVFWMPPE